MAKKRKRTNTGIPGLSFSWKRALGVSRARHKIARKTGVPTTKTGIQRKVGAGCLALPLLPLRVIWRALRK